MRIRNNALLLFSKLPRSGLVKTRLTPAKGGLLSPDEASALYASMLFDVAEICLAAFDRLEANAKKDPDRSVLDSYQLIISTAPLEDVATMQALFAQAGKWPREIRFIGDEGASFDEHYNDAFEKTWEMGADCILSMGADMPALTVDDVVRGFEALHLLELDDKSGIVLAPDQEMGVSIVGWNRDTEFDHTGVFYNPDGLTVLPAYINKARRHGMSAIYLPPVPDVDTMADLMHAITIVEALGFCAEFDGNTPPWRTSQTLQEIGWSEVRVPPNDLMDPRDELDSPR